MSKEQKQIAVIAVGLVFIAVLAVMQFVVKKKPKEVNYSAREGDAVVTVLGAGVQTPGGASAVKFDLPPLPEDIAQKQKLGAQQPWGRNPFVLNAVVMEGDPAQDNPLSGLEVTAIVLREGTGMAVVGEDIVREGDKLRGYTVIKISDQGIELEKDGKKVVMPYVK